jgi:hypothetical protein
MQAGSAADSVGKIDPLGYAIMKWLRQILTLRTFPRNDANKNFAQIFAGTRRGKVSPSKHSTIRRAFAQLIAKFPPPCALKSDFIVAQLGAIKALQSQACCINWLVNLPQFNRAMDFERFVKRLKLQS